MSLIPWPLPVQAATRPRAYLWLPLLIGFIVMATAGGWWHVLITREHDHIVSRVTLHLEGVKNEITVRMESRILALVRMASRWELTSQPVEVEWQTDAQLYLRHYAGYLAIAWINPQLQVRWQTPPEVSSGLAKLAQLPAEVGIALPASRDRHQVTLTPVFEWATGDRVFLVNVPMYNKEGFGGFIVGVLQVQSLLDNLLWAGIAPGYGISIIQGDQIVYRRGPPPTEALRKWVVTAPVNLQNQTWQVDIWPLPEELAVMRSALPLAALAGGLIVAVLLASAVHWAQVAQFRAYQIEQTNRQLQTQMSERRQDQERLRKLSYAVEQSPIMVVITDTRGVIEYVNPKFTQVTGYTLGEVLGKKPQILSSGETPPQQYQRLWETITAGGEWRGELLNKNKTGEIYWERIAISPIRNQDGVITHFLGEMEDITEQKRLEQEIAARNREIADSQALAAMGGAASMIAHDLRNPLSTIKMSLQIVGKRLGDTLSETERELNQIALEQVRYMEHVLADLLTYSHPDALTLEWFTIDKLLDKAILLVQKEIGARKVMLETHYQPGLPTFHGDANKLRRAFCNLIANAAQATEGNPVEARKIEIHTRLQFKEESPAIIVAICDNGCGIPPELMEHIFDPFFTTRAKGTGLGLSIAKRIIDQHHGGIQVEALEHGGAQVVVILPVGHLEEAR